MPALAEEKLAKGEAEQIAEEAFVYGFPLVMNYAVFYEYFVDKSGPEYKAPPNQLYNTARVYTPKDTAVVTPNSDTPYSFVAMDLRAEPFVVCNPEIEKGRYFSVQLVDMYTFNYGYMGSRTTGNDAGCFMIAGPRWTGEKPEGIHKMFRSETRQLFEIALRKRLHPSCKVIEEGQNLCRGLGHLRHQRQLSIARQTKHARDLPPQLQDLCNQRGVVPFRISELRGARGIGSVQSLPQRTVIRVLHDRKI
jgi:hypothetical protein